MKPEVPPAVDATQKKRAFRVKTVAHGRLHAVLVGKFYLVAVDEIDRILRDGAVHEPAVA